MTKELSKGNKVIEREKKEERGLWLASSFLNGEICDLIKNNKPVYIDLIIEAHRVLFTSIGGEDKIIGGRFRKSNSPELKRIDGTFLKMTDYSNIANEIAILNEELTVKTKNLRRPTRKAQYKNIISLAAALSHRFATIHPFENGNGRASRLLLNAILKRAGLYWLDSDVSVSSKNKEKDKYLRAMRQADDGDYTILERIITNSLLQTSLKLYKRRKPRR